MVLNVYKEKGWTSFDVVANLRSISKTKKIGHAGTLDPLAEGVLLVLTDDDTKKQDEFMGMEKEYLAEIALGATSPTFDLEGELSFSNKTDVTKEQVEEALKKYIGTYEQKVPAFSATKVEGERLYKKARAGEVDEEKLPAKEVTVSNIKVASLITRNIQDHTLPVAVIEVTSGKGFYVRSLANDLGNDLGTGAVLVRLVRTRVGDYKVSDSKRINDIRL